VSYQPIDTGFFQTDRPLPAVVAYIASNNAETVAELRLNGWGLFWPAGVVDTVGSSDLDDLIGMVYTASHGTNSTDYSGLYVSTPAGRPMSIPIPVVLSGRASKVRVYVTYSVTAPADGVVHMAAQVARAGTIYPRPWSPNDLDGGTLPVNVNWDGCQDLDTASLGADGWAVAEFEVDGLPLTYSDDAPGDGTMREASHVILTILSNYPNDPPVYTVAGASEVSPIEWFLFFPNQSVGIKPHVWIRYSRQTATEQLDFDATEFAYVLANRYQQSGNHPTSIVWPPYSIGIASVETTDAPAIRILAIRVEEVR
jgi:hypothetical protein